MKTFREWILESSSKKLNNTYKITWDEAKKIAKKINQKWEKEGQLQLMYDGKTHIMTYNTNTGELYCDLSLEDIKAFIK